MDEGHAFLGNGSRAGAGDFDQLATGVGPAVGQLNARARPVRHDQPVVSGIAVHLQDAAEALQNPLGMLPSPTRCIGKAHTRRCCAAPGSIIAGERPELSGLGLLGPRIENRCAGFVHEEFCGPFQIGHQGIEDRAQLKGGTAC